MKRYTTVQVLKPCQAEYCMWPDTQRTEQLNRGWAIGNYEGHFKGVEVRIKDGLASLTLRAEFTETWTGIPLECLQLGSEMVW